MNTTYQHPQSAYPLRSRHSAAYLTGFWDGWYLTGAKSEDPDYLKGYDEGMRDIMEEYAS